MFYSGPQQCIQRSVSFRGDVIDNGTTQKCHGCSYRFIHRTKPKRRRRKSRKCDNCDRLMCVVCIANERICKCETPEARMIELLQKERQFMVLKATIDAASKKKELTVETIDCETMEEVEVMKSKLEAMNEMGITLVDMVCESVSEVIEKEIEKDEPPPIHLNPAAAAGVHLNSAEYAQQVYDNPAQPPIEEHA